MSSHSVTNLYVIIFSLCEDIPYNVRGIVMNIRLGLSVFLQMLFLYIFISGMLLDLNSWNAVIVYISAGVLSLIVGMDLVTNNQVTLTVIRGYCLVIKRIY